MIEMPEHTVDWEAVGKAKRIRILMKDVNASFARETENARKRKQEHADRRRRLETRRRRKSWRVTTRRFTTRKMPSVAETSGMSGPPEK